MDVVESFPVTSADAAADSSPALAPDLAPPAPPSTRFDPGALVPEEYDLFCEGCAYSLVGLEGDRCPECGLAFEPLDLPFARVPWLHRRRLGIRRAYFTTVGQVVFRPKAFAEEMCRPVRISKVDAARFRRLSIRVAIAAALVTAFVYQKLTGASARGMRTEDYVLAWLSVVVGVIAAEVFLRLATDVPLFIWKGLPSSDPTELAPLHHYAAAPLGLAVWVFPLTASLPLLAELLEAPVAARVAAFAIGGGVLLAWLVLLWVTPVRLMRAATGCDRRQVRKLALYLPIHWLLMGIVVTLGVITAMAAFGYVEEALR